MTFDELKIGNFYKIKGGMDNTALCFIEPGILMLLFENTGSAVTLIDEEVISNLKKRNFIKIKPNYLLVFSLIFSNKFLSYI